ncbi:hypothetical protein D3C72_730660 [compost metagenome]
MPARELGELQEVVDEREHPVRAVEDAADCLLLLRGDRAVELVFEHRGEAHDEVQRRAQLVRDHREELVLVTVRAPQFVHLLPHEPLERHALGRIERHHHEAAAERRVDGRDQVVAAASLGAVGRLDDELVAVRGVGLPGGHRLIGERRHVALGLGIELVGPPADQRLGVGQAVARGGRVVGRAVHVVRAAVRDRPGKGVHHRRHQPGLARQLGVRLGQGVLDALALRDVRDHPHHAQRPAGGVVNDRRARPHVAPLAVGAHQPALVIEAVEAVAHPLELRDGLVDMVGHEGVGDGGERGREGRRVVPMEPVEAIGPRQLVGPEVPLPGARRGHALGLDQEPLAVAQPGVGQAIGRHVVKRDDHQPGRVGGGHRGREPAVLARGRLHGLRLGALALGPVGGRPMPEVGRRHGQGVGPMAEQAAGLAVHAPHQPSRGIHHEQGGGHAIERGGERPGGLDGVHGAGDGFEHGGHLAVRMSGKTDDGNPQLTIGRPLEIHAATFVWLYACSARLAGFRRRGPRRRRP